MTKHNLWIVMEYCGGGSVSDIMKSISSGLQEGFIQYICGETLKAILIIY